MIRTTVLVAHCVAGRWPMGCGAEVEVWNRVETKKFVAIRVARIAVLWLSVSALVFCSVRVMAEEQIDRSDIVRIREEFIRNLPVQRQDSFRSTPYGWTAWAFDQLRSEALAASLTLSFMTATTVGRHSFQNLLDNTFANSAGDALRLYGLLVADVGVDALTSRHWGEFVYRSGINLFSWLGADYLGPLPTLGLRYLVVHGALLAETLPEIGQGWQSRFRGVQQLACLGSPVCEAVPVYYHIPDAEHSSADASPWLSLEFPETVEMVAAGNPMEQALLDLWSWAREQGVEALYLYPSTEGEQLRLHVQSWQYDRPGVLLELPGQYGSGGRAGWWTQLFQRPLTPDAQGYQQVNPLHYEILVRLPALLSGEAVTPAVITGTVPDDLASTLLAVDAGEWGGVIADNHFSQGYNIPDLYLDLHQPFDELHKRALVTLSQQRGAAPRRGFYKLLEGFIRSTLYRAVFEWGLSHFLSTQATRVGDPPTDDHDHAPRRRAPLSILAGPGINPVDSVPADDVDNLAIAPGVMGDQVQNLDHSDPDSRHILVLGQPRAGKTSFIKHLTGQEPVVSESDRQPQTYEPMDVEGFDKPVVFSEISLKPSSMNKESPYPALVTQIKRADNVVWCGDLQHFSRSASTVNPSAAEDQQKELALFEMVTKTVFAHDRRPALVITHADNPVLRNDEGISSLDTLVQNQDLEKLKRLYQRATTRYQKAAGGVDKRTAFLMADGRDKEPALFYPELTSPLVRDKVHRELQQKHEQETRELLSARLPSQILAERQLVLSRQQRIEREQELSEEAIGRNEPQSWWQAAIHYLRAVTPATTEAASP